MYLLCLLYLLLECGDGIGAVSFCDCVMCVEKRSKVLQRRCRRGGLDGWVCFEHTRFAALLLLHMRVVFVAFTNQICVFKEINT